MAKSEISLQHALTQERRLSVPQPGDAQHARSYEPEKYSGIRNIARSLFSWRGNQLVEGLNLF